MRTLTTLSTFTLFALASAPAAQASSFLDVIDALSSGNNGSSNKAWIVDGNDAFCDKHIDSYSWGEGGCTALMIEVPGKSSDDLVLKINPNDEDEILVFVNGTRLFDALEADLDGVFIYQMGDGNDTVTVDGLRLPVAASMGSGADTVDCEDSLRACNFHLGKGSDTFYGGPNRDMVDGHDGEDVLYGNGGHDGLWGGRMPTPSWVAMAATTSTATAVPTP